MDIRKRAVALTICLALLCGIFGSSDATVLAASKVKLNKTSVTLVVGATTKLKVTGTKKKVKWSSSKASVAKVSSGGKVTAVKAGKATITAKVKGKKYRCKVTVKSNKTAAQSVLNIVNKQRKKQGRKALKLDAKLTKAAQKRAKELTKVFAHERPDGSSCFTVLKDYNISYMACGENIAAGQRSAKEVMNAWMNSDGHRENILSTNYGKIGVGLYKSPNTQYTYYWVQLFTN